MSHARRISYSRVGFLLFFGEESPQIGLFLKKNAYLCTRNELITAVNEVIWSYVLIVALVGCGLWFTWRTRFVQFRMVGEMIRLLTESAVDSARGRSAEGCMLSKGYMERRAARRSITSSDIFASCA